MSQARMPGPVSRAPGTHPRIHLGALGRAIRLCRGQEVAEQASPRKQAKSSSQKNVRAEETKQEVLTASAELLLLFFFFFFKIF